MAFFPEILRGDALCGKQSSCNRTAGNPSGFSPRSRNRGRHYKLDRNDGRRRGRPDLEIGAGPTNRQNRNRAPFGSTQDRHRRIKHAILPNEPTGEGVFVGFGCVVGTDTARISCTRNITGASRFARLAANDCGVPSDSAPSDLATGAEGAYICFCETNPPIFEEIYYATFSTQGCCVEKRVKNSVGSFWKTNPPGGVF
jgi:hypothetical protein